MRCGSATQAAQPTQIKLEHGPFERALDLLPTERFLLKANVAHLSISNIGQARCACKGRAENLVENPVDNAESCGKWWKNRGRSLPLQHGWGKMAHGGNPLPPTQFQNGNREKAGKRRRDS